MMASIYVVSRFPLSAALLIFSYPVMHFWDLKFTYDNLYLLSEEEFRRIEQNIPLVAFERRFGFKKATILNALWSFSIFLFLSFFFAPVIIAPYLGVTLSPLACFASGAAFLAAVHAHALALNRIRSVA